MGFLNTILHYVKNLLFIYLNLCVFFTSIAQGIDEIENIIEMLSIEEKIAVCHAQSKFSSSGVPRLGIPELWMSRQIKTSGFLVCPSRFL